VSKEADKEIKEATTDDRRRRRRKGGGLRVPSDNVPRRTGEVAAPAPEDPHLAVSVAYAFGAAEERAAELEVERELDDDDSDGVGGYDDSDGVGGQDDPDAGDQRALAAGSSESNDEAGSYGGEGFGHRTEEMPAVQLEGLAHDEPHTGDSVDISFDEDGNEQGSPRPVRTRAMTMALSDEDLEELRVSVERERGDTDPQAEAYDEISSAPADEAGSSSDAAVAGPTSEAAPGEAADLDEADEVDDASESDGGDQVDGGWSDSGPVSAAAPDADADAAVPAAVTSLEQQAIESPVVEPGDPGDSGEIIADDLIEEVDDTAQPVEPPPPPQVTKPVAARAPTSDPPPVPGDSSAAASAAQAPAKPIKPPPAPKKDRGAAVAAAPLVRGDLHRGLPADPAVPHAPGDPARSQLRARVARARTGRPDPRCGLWLRPPRHGGRGPRLPSGGPGRLAAAALARRRRGPAARAHHQLRSR
jgi:hypothetical protein